MSNPAVVQVSTKGAFSNNTTASATLTGVTAGNTLLAVVTHHNNQSNGAGTTVSDGTAYTNDLFKAGSGGDSGAFSLEVFRLDNAGAGSHTATTTASFGTTGYGQIILIEASGLIASPTDATVSSNGNSTHPSSGTTATLAQSVELAIAVMTTDASSVAGETNPPSGWTSNYNDTSTGSNTLSINSQITAATTALSASWGTLTTACQWIAGIVTYKAVQAAAVPYPPMNNGGMIVQVCQ